MFLNDYQVGAVSTAIYPDEVAVTYPTLGLADEFGEFVEKTHVAPNLVAKEMGDILWYIANLATDLDTPLDELTARIGAPTTRLEAFQQWTDENRASFTVADPSDFMAIKIGAICGLVKKLYRDDGGQLLDGRREKILTNLAWVLAGVSVLATQLGLSLTAIAEGNLRKLASRQERGTLHGDGDER